MAMNTGARASYTDTNPNRENVEDAILLVSPKDVPLLKVIVGLNEAKDKAPKIDTLPEPCEGTKYEWINRFSLN